MARGDYGGSQADVPSSSTFSCVGAGADLEVRGTESEGCGEASLEGTVEQRTLTMDHPFKPGQDRRGAVVEDGSMHRWFGCAEGAQRREP